MSPDINRGGKPPAIVLGLNVTGLAVVRALAESGVTVHGVSLAAAEPGRSSRRCKVIDLRDRAGDSEALCHWVIDYARQLGVRPVVFPTGDKLALMLAQHHDQLIEVCRIWNNPFDQLSAIISKDQLYALASAAGVRVPPGLISPQVDEVEKWCETHPGPYLVKPYYQQAATFKNRFFDDTETLSAFLRAREPGASDLVIQRVLRGGDGWVFDCYGLCDRNGQVRTMATHRRIRQYPSDFGATCYGEIPGVPRGGGEQVLFDLTRTLLERVPYHGIFGIEWLQDQDSGELYLLDFNARPFYSIGHLRDCGVNLPMLAYRELCGDDLSDLALIPGVRRLFWLDFWHDVSTFNTQRREGRITWRDWIASLARSGSYALWSASDPGPAVSRYSWRKIKSLARQLVRRWRGAHQSRPD